MSKGSLFFGNASGKLGQVVLTTVKGQQIARAWQPKVANPRTSSQQTQRAKFANAVKFYRRATSNLFKFAFEDKRKTESDYNAFMRHNVDRAMIIDRASYDNVAYPAIGYNWLMSAGSLGNVAPSADGELDNRVTFSQVEFTGTKEPSALTVADVSQSFMLQLGALEGDYVTVVAVNASIKKINDVPSNLPEWSIVQFRIDSTDNTHNLMDIIKEQKGENWGATITKISDTNYISATNMSGSAWMAVILSRVTTGGVLVSTSDLVGSKVANDIYLASLQLGYRSAALNSWNRKSEAILKGAIFKESSL